RVRAAARAIEATRSVFIVRDLRRRGSGRSVRSVAQAWSWARRSARGGAGAEVPVAHLADAQSPIGLREESLVLLVERVRVGALAPPLGLFDHPSSRRDRRPASRQAARLRREARGGAR